MVGRNHRGMAGIWAEWPARICSLGRVACSDLQLGPMSEGPRGRRRATRWPWRWWGGRHCTALQCGGGMLRYGEGKRQRLGHRDRSPARLKLGSGWHRRGHQRCGGCWRSCSVVAVLDDSISIRRVGWWFYSSGQHGVENRRSQSGGSTTVEQLRTAWRMRLEAWWRRRCRCGSDRGETVPQCPI
jgi:hypothetical protein